MIEVAPTSKNWFKSEVTALQLAAASGCYQLVEELVSRGAILAGVGITVPDTDEGHRIVQFLQSRGSNQCTRFTPETSTQDEMHILKPKAVMNRLMGPGYGFEITISAELGSKHLGNILYDAGEDGWQSSDLHRKCDQQGHCLFLMRTTDDAVIGAFVSGWNSAGSYTADPNAFLFEINADGGMMKCAIKPGDAEGHAFEGHAFYGLGGTFGNHSFNDLVIPSMPNNTECTANAALRCTVKYCTLYQRW